MSLPFATGQRSTALDEDNLRPQSSETGQVIPAGQDSGRDGPPVVKPESTVKPWAHFVAGGEHYHHHKGEHQTDFSQVLVV